MKKSLFNRFLSASLSVSLLAALVLPAAASGNVTYEFEDGTEHTIRWAEGIAAPQMASEDQKGSFEKAEITIGPNTYEVLNMPYKGSQGWYDLTQEKKPEKEKKEKPSEKKEVKDTDNSNNKEEIQKEIKLVFDSGYAASAANLTYWWLQENQENLQKYLESNPKQELKLADPDGIYDMLLAPASQKAEDYLIFNLFMEAFPEEAEPDQLFDFFLNGYTAKELQANSEDAYIPNEQGGFFYPVFEKNLLTRREEATIETLRDVIAKNDGGILRLQKEEEIRYVNLWGMETTDGGNLCALFVTDSQDELGMVRYEVTDKDGLQIAGMEITGLYGISLGEEIWSDYEPSKPVPQEEAAPESQPTAKPESEQKPEKETKPEIHWQEPTYEWNEDKSICVAKRTAQDDSEKSETEEVKSVSEQTLAPTHKEPGIMTYTADFEADWAKTQVVTEKIPQKQITWKAPVYEWDESMRICTATRTAEEDPSIKETAMAGVDRKETREPTCTQKGQTTFTAEFEEDWAETQVKVLDNIETLSPNWNITEYKWSEDHQSCTAVRICKNEADGSHRQEAQAAVSSEQTRKPTSTQKGTTTYTAVFSVDWASTQETTADDIPMLDANWTEPTYSWTQDLKTCIATRIDRNDPNRKEIAETTVTSEITRNSTCTAMGETTYTAVFKEPWAVTQSQVRNDVPKMEPNWGEVQYQWSDDHRSCTATRVCQNEENHAETVQAKVNAKTAVKPTVTSEGETRYTAEFNVEWAKKQEITVKDIPALHEKWGRPSYQWTEDLSKCIATRVSLVDSERTQTAYGVVTSKKTKVPTSTAKGETTYTATFKEDWANTQKKVVANIPPLPSNPNEKPQPAEGPQWNPVEYEWSDDFSRCTARRSRRGDQSNVELAKATITKQETKAPTCAVPGEAVYTAKFTEKWAKDQVRKSEIKTLDHTLEKVEEVEATAAKEGLQAHYECSVCHKLFLDSKGKQEVTKEQLRLTTPSVTDGYAILNGVPEKENLIAISADKFKQTMKDNPGSVGVSISVGSASVTYDQQDIDKILAAAGNNQKLQLEIYRTDSLDSSLTLEQIGTADRNPEGILYRAQLSYVKNGINVPIDNLQNAILTVPYTGAESVRVYRVAEDGTLGEINGSLKDSYVSFQGENGLYMLSESKASAVTPEKPKSNVGFIIWISVLVISGLLCLGVLGFFLYQKKLEQDEAAEPHKFSAAGKENTEGFENDNEFNFDDDAFLKDLDLSQKMDFSEEIHLLDDIESELTSEPAIKTPASPVAPKAPMEPTIAEKTADAANKKHL